MSSDAALAKVLETAGQCFQEQARQINQLLQLAEALARQQAAPTPQPPTDEEKEILDLFTDGCVLTGAQIAKMLGLDTDNGTLRSRLASMVKKGILLNKRPGYALSE